jgi:hypothetical protein
MVMSSWLVWTVTAVLAFILAWVGYQFSIRTLRWVACAVAAATAIFIAWYGLIYPAQRPGSLTSAFARGADTLSSALLGHRVPAPGRVGWVVIVVLLVLGYRGLEAWTLHRQAPSLDVSALTSDRQDDAADAKKEAADAKKQVQTGQQRHDWLVAELKFRLPAVEVRGPAILPGGSRPVELASIAEATGVNGAGLAGAIIRFFGTIWPNPPQIQVRAWVERVPGRESIDDTTKVTVGLADPRSGASLATKTLAAGSLDAAADAVAGYVARHIFDRDRTVPPWSASASDGADLAALLRARQVRGYPESRGEIRGAWRDQIKILEGVAHGNLCAGVVRYELAQLYDLTNRHAEALLLHALNREQYPRFYRGHYRLAMSLEMLANPQSEPGTMNTAALREALQILDRCHVTVDAAKQVDGKAGLPDPLRRCLLAAAQAELQAIRKYLTWRRIIWGSFWRRNERGVLRPYRSPRHRQAFHDGVCVALLLVAVRQAVMDGRQAVGKLQHPRTIARIAVAISEDSDAFATALRGFPGKTKSQAIPERLRTRRWPWQCSTPSWTAAYNLACAYAALAADPNMKTGVDLVDKVVASLEFVVRNPECGMERPSEWIDNDPDFGWLRRTGNVRFAKFFKDQQDRDYPADSELAGRLE